MKLRNRPDTIVDVEPPEPQPRPPMPTRESEAAGAARETLRESVHGRQMTCSECGAHGPCDVDSAHVETAGASGRDHLYGRCPACVAAERVGRVDRHAIAQVLDVDPDAIALDGLNAERFAHQHSSSPTSPNATPWDHLDREHLAKIVAARRHAFEARRGGPCEFCGVVVTPPGTAWSMTNGTQPYCGSCASWFAGFNLGGRRDLAAAALCGIATAGRRIAPRGLGAETGLVWWSESGRREGNPAPFAHVDLARLRAKAAALAREGYIDDVGSRADKPVQW